MTFAITSFIQMYRDESANRNNLTCLGIDALSAVCLATSDLWRENLPALSVGIGQYAWYLGVGIGVADVIAWVMKRGMVGVPQAEELTWKELTFLMSSEHAFGLRHAGDYAEAVRQKKQGFEGDSLNLDLSDSECWKRFFPNTRVDTSGYSERDRWFLWPERVSNELQQKAIEFWTQGVEAFLGDSYWIESHSAFLLIDYGPLGKGAYDLHYGNGLGKKGKKRVEPSQIIVIIEPPNPSLSGKALITHYRNALIRAIRAQVPTSF